MHHCSLANEKALIDLIASINVITYEMVNKLGLRGTDPTIMTLLLASRLIMHPRGIIEDVLV